MSSIEKGFATFSASGAVFSSGNSVAGQVRSRMAELAKGVDAEGMTAVKLNKDGTYEITSEHKGAEAERLKAEVAQTLANDEALTSLIKEYQAQYQSMLDKETRKSNTDANGDKAEISAESRALLERAAAKQQRGVDGNAGQKHQFTMKIDMDIVEANEPPISLANRYYVNVSGQLQKAALETGEFENDFIIEFDEQNNLVIADVTGRSGAVENEKTAAEKSRIESFLESINQAMKNDEDAGDSDLVKTLRRFIEVAGRANAAPESGSDATHRLYTLPFTLWGSTTRG